jgi:predicted HTH transcriptional regulator
MNLTETFDRLGLNEIEEFLKLEQEEHLHLDFKTINNANLNGRDDKRSLATAISGFANSSGGLIVWGIDARKNAREVDCAVGREEIAPINLFLSRLNTLTGEAVSPIVDGIRHRAIKTTEDKGFAITLVPESESGPHMAKLGEDRYYKRSGDSFYRMEHFDLEDMFGRRQRPFLGLEIVRGPAEDDNLLEDLSFRVTNTGRAVAKHSGFWLRLDNAEIKSVHDGLKDISAINGGLPTVSFEHMVGVIHPNGISLSAGRVRLRRTNPAEKIALRVHLYCENMRPIEQKADMAPQQTVSQSGIQEG